jgi:hypothetical protein
VHDAKTQIIIIIIIIIIIASLKISNLTQIGAVLKRVFAEYVVDRLIVVCDAV